VGGNFFDSVPAGLNAYILKSVLHDWGDEDCIRILKTIREACRAGSRLLVLEWLVGPPNEDQRSKLSDLNMMVMLGGQERTAEAWAGLLKAGGFDLGEIIPTRSGMSVILEYR
jgi:hypothetical protein